MHEPITDPIIFPLRVHEVRERQMPRDSGVPETSYNPYAVYVVKAKSDSDLDDDQRISIHYTVHRAEEAPRVGSFLEVLVTQIPDSSLDPK